MKKKIIRACIYMLLITSIISCFASTTIAEDKPDLRVTSLWRGYIGETRFWQMGYTMYNAGIENIVNENFTDRGYYYWGDWYGIANSSKTHNNFYLNAQTYSDNYFYNWNAPPGNHLFQQWVDIYEEVPDSNYNNNYKQDYWDWDDL
jgi:hypothetical protein